MKCNDIRLNLEPFIAGELSPGEKDEVQEHLQSCQACRQELAEIREKVAWLRGARDMGVRMPDRLESRLIRRFQGKPVKKKNPWRLAIAASITLAVFLTSFYSGTIAQFLEDMPLIQKYFSFGDKGIEHSLGQGAGQVIEESKTVDGITVTVHRLIADQNRTVALYSLTAEGIADTAWLEAAILNHKGHMVDQSGVYTFHEDLQKVTGNIKTIGIDELGSKIQIQFTNIRLQKTYTQELSFVREGEQKQTVTLQDDDGNVVGEYTLEMTEASEDVLQIVTTWSLSDPGIEDPYISGLYQGETELIQKGFFGSNGYASYTYTLDNPDEKTFTLALAFKKSVAGTQEPITFQIKVNRDLAKESSYEKEVMQRIELEKDVFLTVEKIVATASQTAIEYSIDADGEQVRDFMDIDLSLSRDGETFWFNHEIRDISQGRFALSFDPTIPLDNLTLRIKGYQKAIFTPLDLSFGLEDVSQTLLVEGQPLTIENVAVEEPMAGSGDEHLVVVHIAHPFVSFTNAQVSDSAGTRDIVNASVHQRTEDGNLISILTFDSRDTAWSLHMSPYLTYQEKNIEITI